MTESTLGTAEVRDLRQDDHKAVFELARITFPINQSRFVDVGNAGGKVVTADGKLVAASLLRTFSLPSGRKVGFVAWLMTHPEYRGRSFAKLLINASNAHLQAQDCDDIATDVEGYNTGSANAFFRSGYQRLSMWQLVRRWSLLDVIWFWIKSRWAIDPGHFLWVAEAVGKDASPWRDRSLSLLFNTLLALLATLMGGGLFLSGGSVTLSIHSGAAFIAGIGSLLAAREMGLRLVSVYYRQPLEYRAWSGGWGLSLLIALGFGKVLPLPGNLYPSKDGWSTRDLQTMFGQGAIVSTLLVICLILLGSYSIKAQSSDFFAQFGYVLLAVGKPLLLFDTLVAVAPFEGFNGRHLRDYNRWVWIILSAFSVILLFWI